MKLSSFQVDSSALYLFAFNEAPPYIPLFVNTER